MADIGLKTAYVKAIKYKITSYMIKKTQKTHKKHSNYIKFETQNLEIMYNLCHVEHIKIKSLQHSLVVNVKQFIINFEVWGSSAIKATLTG